MTIYSKLRGGTSLLENLRAPHMDVLGMDVGEGFRMGGPALLRSSELREAEYGKPIGIEGIADPSGELYQQKPLLSAETARSRIQKEGLDIAVPDEGIRQEALDILIERGKDNRRRQDLYNRAPGGVAFGAARFGAMLAGSVFDPLNIATAFVPVVGQTRYAQMAARFGTFRARAMTGAIEGTAGAAMVEPVIYGAAQHLQDDYGLQDSVLNIALGTVLGGGLHVGIGAAGDLMARRRSRVSGVPLEPLPAMIDALPFETKEAALRTAVAQAVTGRAIDVEPVLGMEMGSQVGASFGPEWTARVDDGAPEGVTGAEPPVPDGMVRMYHGGDPVGDSPLWFTSSRKYAADRGAGLSYVDLPRSHEVFETEIPGQTVDEGFTVNTELPTEIAAQRKPLGAVTRDEAIDLPAVAAAVTDAGPDDVRAVVDGIEEIARDPEAVAVVDEAVTGLADEVPEWAEIVHALPKRKDGDPDIDLAIRLLKELSPGKRGGKYANFTPEQKIEMMRRVRAAAEQLGQPASAPSVKVRAVDLRPGDSWGGIGGKRIVVESVQKVRGRLQAKTNAGVKEFPTDATIYVSRTEAADASPAPPQPVDLAAAARKNHAPEGKRLADFDAAKAADKKIAEAPKEEAAADAAAENAATELQNTIEAIAPDIAKQGGEPDWWQELTSAGKADLIRRTPQFTRGERTTWQNMKPDERAAITRTHEAAPDDLATPPAQEHITSQEENASGEPRGDDPRRDEPRDPRGGDEASGSLGERPQEVSAGEQPEVPGGPRSGGADAGVPDGDRLGGAGDVRGDASPDAQQPEPADGVLRAGEGARGDPSDGQRAGDARTDTPAGARPERELSDRETERSARQERNHRITPEDNIGQGGAREKVTSNIEAIRTLKAIEGEKREATPDERKALVRYVGWGAFAQDVFAEHKKEWAAERAQMKDLLTPEEYQSARASTLNAHYTSEVVIRGVWHAIEHLGFNGGRALEPAAGIGHFVGMVPDSISPRTDWSMVELDSLTGRMAKMLYAGADVNVQGFETFKRPAGFYDLAISNVPFGNYKLVDRSYPPLLIHDYFFVKSLDLVRPGGLVSFITSSGTMDKVSDRARAEITKRADLIGAIRLPGGKGGAFAKNAGTEVTTDILFLRKRNKGEAPSPLARAWQELAEITTPDGPTHINEYFASHPEMMLGEMRLQSTMYRAGEPMLAGDTANLDARIAEAVAKLPADVFLPRGTRHVAEAVEPETTTDVAGVKEGAFFEKDGKLFRRVIGVGVEAGLTAPDAKKVRGLIGMRNLVSELLANQAKGTNTDNNALRAKLNKAYDTFVKANGPINLEKITTTSRIGKDGQPIVQRRLPNFSQFKVDPDAYKLGSIENYDPETGKATKAAIFDGDIVGTLKAPEIVTVADAIPAALNARGWLDFDYIGALLDKPKHEIIRELGDRIYLNPKGEQWQASEQYLSGDVLTKLEEAQQAAKLDSSFERNIAALEKVQPEPLTRDQISAPLGASWIPPEVVTQFVQEEVGGTPTIRINPVTKRWTVSGWFGTAEQAKYGIDKVKVEQIVEAALNQTPIKVVDRHSDGSTTVDQKATTEAGIKVRQLRAAFAGNREAGLDGWVWTDNDRSMRLEGLYNQGFNRLAPQKFDGNFLTLPGIAGRIRNAAGKLVPFDLRGHQKNAVWRILQNGNTLLAHVVGSGKTYTMIAAGMEMRRLGQIARPMYVVPNHMLEQFSREFYQAYPGANLLIAHKEETSANQRRAFAAKIAAQKWDGIIITHDAFGRMPMSDKAYAEYVQSEINEVLDAIHQAREDEGKGSATVKDLEKRRKTLEVKLAQLTAKDRKDVGVTFEELGVDFLFVDEAHLFKNLNFSTRHTRVKGLAQGNAQRATDLFIKIGHLDKQRPGKSAVFATGTPISNTIAEMYTMQRYLQLPAMRDYGVDKFDAWASTFGEIVSQMELAPDGRTFRETSSFSRFLNIPELVSIYSLVADTQTAQMLNLPRPALKGSKPTIIEAEPSPFEEAYIANLVKRAENMKGKRPEKGADNMLKIVGEGRKVATDMRLIHPDASINPGGKVARATEEIYRRWKEGKEPALAQMVFIDMGVPQAKTTLSKEISKRWNVGDMNKKAELVTAAGLANAEVDIALKWKDLPVEVQQRIGTVIFNILQTGKRQHLDDDSDVIEVTSLDDSALFASKFNLYDDLRERLAERGIPRQQIAFIHEAGDDTKKAALFERVRNGKVRVLIGSSGKMGVGTNVQTRLSAMHHLDAPWRPADVEQRDGRILRQGNLNKEVEILRYVTKRSFDSFMWQTLERKSKFISQIQAGARGIRSAEDVDNPLPEAAELKAAAAGDPRIMEHAELSKKLRDLEAQKASHTRTMSRAFQELASARGTKEYHEQLIVKADKDAAKVRPMAGDKFSVELAVGPKGTINDRTAAGTAIRDFINDQSGKVWGSKIETFKVGTMSDLTMTAAIHRHGSGVEYTVGLAGELTYGGSMDWRAVHPEIDPVGLMKRYEHFLADVPTYAGYYQGQVRKADEAIAGLIPQTVAKPFAGQSQLQETAQKITALEAALSEKPKPAEPGDTLGAAMEQAQAAADALDAPGLFGNDMLDAQKAADDADSFGRAARAAALCQSRKGSE